MKDNSLEITKYIQLARKNQKEGNLYQANEIYRKLINQKNYSFNFIKLKDCTLSVFIKNNKVLPLQEIHIKKRPALMAGLFKCVVLITN